jgi:glucose-1-phosphate thymidylyltransferase
MYLGDNFIVGGITGIVEEFRATPECDASILLTRVRNPSDFGVAELDAGGRVVRLEEKPTEPRSDLALVGVYLFGPRIHAAVADIRPSKRGELEITDAIQWLLDNAADVRSHTIEGYWKDTGNVTDMLEVNRTVLETLVGRVDGDVDAASELIGRVVVEAGAVVRDSRIVGPAIIGADAIVDRCYVGPFTSIGPRVRLTETEIEYSIVLDDSAITGVDRIEASLIGKEVEVTAASRPRAHRLVLGDHSQVRITR